MEGMADEPEEPQNPFKGTPFEQFFTAGMSRDWAGRACPTSTSSSGSSSR